MNLIDKYFELCYTRRIHEFSKIDVYKNWDGGTARKLYKSLDKFYLEELNVDLDELLKLRFEFQRFNQLYSKYFNDDRIMLFEHSERFLEWYDKQNGCCDYCGITQPDLDQIVQKRDGNLTLNQRTKRSKGTLEIEKLNPEQGYTYKNCVLACPFCNNAKSNLISEEDWRRFFAPIMRDYLNSILLK